MALVREVIRSALRKVGAVTRGREPSEAQANDALETFQSLLLEWATTGLFGSLTDRTVTGDVTGAEGDRIILDTEAAVDITLPVTLDDEYGVTRPPLDLAMIQVVDPYATDATASQTYLYDSSMASWVQIDALTLDSTAPLSRWGTDGLACCLAKRLADDYGPALGAQTEQAAARFKSALSHRRSSDTSEGHWY